MRARWVALCWAALIGVHATGCQKHASPAPRTVAGSVEQTSGSCRTCHAEIFDAWAATNHAGANRPVDLHTDGAALVEFAARSGESTPPDFIVGHKPLWQPLLPATGNRWQPHELAFDPARQEWFNVFGHDLRKRGEWGHWTGRGMNWNSMCAHCHMTGYRKNYDAATDRYHSTWVEHGVGCIQCHGPMRPEHLSSPKHEARPAHAPKSARFSGDPSRQMEGCVACHARNELLTLDFQPGDNYHDHYRAELPVDPAKFYPDGQQRDEDFNWTSVLLSRMGHAGVTCLDCHDPHSNRTLLPTANNALCLQCHAAPGRVQPGGTRAIPIDPVSHSHHAEASAGNACVACHMPTTTYMQRAPRHDHGWFKPDPLLTKELGIPNACNRCHTDKPIDWAIEKTVAWYGAKLDSRQRARARAVAAAQAYNPDSSEALLALFAGEDIPAWRATYLSLLASAPTLVDRVIRTATRSLGAHDPLERAAAVRLLGTTSKAVVLLTPLLKDSVRLVRLDAEWSLSRELAEGSAERRELDAYLALSNDQPAGRMRRAADLAKRGRLSDAEREMRIAAAWDPFSGSIRETLGLLFASAGQTENAAAEFTRAAELDPHNATAAFRAALAYAELGQTSAAEASLRRALTRDPKFDRAWYNLGLLLAQSNRPEEAADALRKAEGIHSNSADYPFALATVLLRLGDYDGAHAAALRTLRIDASRGDARHLLDATPHP
jgi:predicted CXXCH cytochrome family protein